MKHILLVKLCKHSSCSHQSLGSCVVGFSQTEPSLSLGEFRLLVLAMWARLAALSFWPHLGRDTEPNLSNLVFGPLVQVRCSWTSSYFCAFDLQDVSCSPTPEFALRPSHGWGHFAVTSQKPPSSKSVWCFFGCSVKFPEQDVLD